MMIQTLAIPTGNIVYVEVKIRGTRPLWQHRFGPEALPIHPREKNGVAGNDPEEWRMTCMIDAQGRPYVHDTYLFATIRDGGRYIKRGRGNLVSLIAATLQVIDEIILVSNRFWPGYENGNAMTPFDPQKAEPPPTDPALPLYLDIRGVRNPSTRNRNIRYRIALSPGWEMQFTIRFDKSIVSREQMHSVLIQAGDLTGIGSGRAVGKGRFEVMAFRELETA
jgi:hypothetical protein